MDWFYYGPTELNDQIFMYAKKKCIQRSRSILFTQAPTQAFSDLPGINIFWNICLAWRIEYLKTINREKSIFYLSPHVINATNIIF